MQIDDTVVAITGASGGMGEATARYLAKRGAKVVLGARSEDRLRALVGDITIAGGAATHHCVDVRRREDVRALARHAVATFGRLDVFVANANARPGISAMFLGSTRTNADRRSMCNVEGSHIEWCQYMNGCLLPVSADTSLKVGLWVLPTEARHNGER